MLQWSKVLSLVPRSCHSSSYPSGVKQQGCWILSCSVHQVSKGEGHTRGKGLSVAWDWFWPWQVSVFSPSLCCPATGWLWHRIGFFRFLGCLWGVVEETALSWVAGLPCLLDGSAAVLGWFSLLPADRFPTWEGQAFRGDRMGATWTHVRFGSELWPALYFERASSSSVLLSFPFVSWFIWLFPATSGETWFASDASDRGRPWLSSWPSLALFSSGPMRGDLRSTGEGVGESVPVQLSRRFWKTDVEVNLKIKSTSNSELVVKVSKIWMLHLQGSLFSHLDWNMQLISVLVRRGRAGSFLERVSRRCSHAGGCRDRLDGDLRKPELEHHLHLEQSVQVLLPKNKEVLKR